MRPPALSEDVAGGIAQARAATYRCSRWRWLIVRIFGRRVREDHAGLRHTFAEWCGERYHLSARETSWW